MMFPIIKNLYADELRWKKVNDIFVNITNVFLFQQEIYLKTHLLEYGS